MSRGFKLDVARHAQGITAYNTGQTLMELLTTARDIDAMHDEIEQKSRAMGDSEEEEAAYREAHDAIDNAVPSLIAGFADGLLADIRAIARGVARPGIRA